MSTYMRNVGSWVQRPSLMMSAAGVINHTDAELTLLEGLVGRKPPFAGIGWPPSTGY